MKPHKFVEAGQNKNHYGTVIFCEYCGMVAYNGNRGDFNRESQAKALSGCSLAPEQNIPELLKPLLHAAMQAGSQNIEDL